MTENKNCIVDWDVEFNRPVVDGKITNPETGEVETAGRLGVVGGPPGIEINLFLHCKDGFTASTERLYTTIDKLCMGLARQVHDGIISIMSIHASAYDFTAILDVKMTRDEYRNAWKNLFLPKSDWLFTEKEWDQWYILSDPGYAEIRRKYVENYGEPKLRDDK